MFRRRSRHEDGSREEEPKKGQSAGSPTLARKGQARGVTVRVICFSSIGATGHSRRTTCEKALKIPSRRIPRGTVRPVPYSQTVRHRLFDGRPRDKESLELVCVVESD